MIPSLQVIVLCADNLEARCEICSRSRYGKDIIISGPFKPDELRTSRQSKLMIDALAYVRLESKWLREVYIYTPPAARGVLLND